jgi:hypothetical protein
MQYWLPVCTSPVLFLKRNEMSFAKIDFYPSRRYFAPQAIIFYLWALIVLRVRRWIYGLDWRRGGLFSEETVWLYVGHCDRYVGRYLIFWHRSFTFKF